MTLVWTLGVPVAAVAFMAGALNLGAVVARTIGSPVAMVLFLPVSALLGIGAWMFVLAATWRLRRYYLRRSGDVVRAAVVDSELQRKHSRGPFGFDLWRVRVEARFTHPETGDESRIQKQFFYLQFQEARARALAEQLHSGASVSVLIRRNSALFEIPKRPVWVDIW